MYTILAINPGSTSTKVALFKNNEKLFSKNISHDVQELRKYTAPNDQFAFRKESILNTVKEFGFSFEEIDAFSGRGGSIHPCEGGTYYVTEKMLEDVRTSPIKHPASLGGQLAYSFAKEYGAKAFIVNAPDTDEFSELARITGLKGIYRESRLHALNQKEIGIRYGQSMNKKYEEMNLIICHIGGGLSVTAHHRGKMVESNDIINGDGPMAPTRCGEMPVKDVINLCFSGKYGKKEVLELTTRSGGWMSHLGTADAQEVKNRIDFGDKYAKLIYDATIYQTAKEVGSCAAVLKGDLEAIILTGGIAHDEYFVNEITKYISFLAPVVVMAGEFEMEALAAGALRVLMGEEESKIYTGEPVWKGFEEMEVSLQF